MKRIVIFLTVMAFLGSMSYAQESQAEILGKVVLADGAALPGVAVTLTGQTYGKVTAVTSEEGNYRFLKITPGVFTLRFELEGFKTVIRKDFRIGIGGSATMNIVMEPGTIQEEITVVGTSPMINTRKASVSLNVTNEVASLLPAARTAREIISLAPGIMTADPVYAMQGSGTTNGLGTRNNQGEYNVDGASFIHLRPRRYADWR